MQETLREKIATVMQISEKFLVGQKKLLEYILASIICEGHLLVEGVPGLGKTSSISILSKLCDLNFNRVQFTPDLLPSDLIGTQIYSKETEKFKTIFGPLFTQILMADEINRSPAKVQSALLEAMGERQITIAGETYHLKPPFVVVATQNPIEHEGTYPLPEAQLDRFMAKVNVDYPDYLDEVKILSLPKDKLREIRPILGVDDIIEAQGLIQKVYVDDKIKDLIVRIVQSTRPTSNFFLPEYKDAVLFGASPRAVQWIFKLSQFWAFMQGQEHVAADNLISVAHYVLGHRIILSYEAKIDKITTKDVVTKILEKVM